METIKRIVVASCLLYSLCVHGAEQVGRQLRDLGLAPAFQSKLAGVRTEEEYRRDLEYLQNFSAKLEAAITERDIKTIDALRLEKNPVGLWSGRPLSTSKKSPLELAAEGGDVGVVKALMKWPQLSQNYPKELKAQRIAEGVAVNSPGWCTNLLGHFAFNNNVKAVKTLIEAGVNPNFVSNTCPQMNALMAAAASSLDTRDVIRFLLDNGADMYVESEDTSHWSFGGEFAPVFVLHGQNFQNIEPFIEFGFDFTRKNLSGRSFFESPLLRQREVTNRKPLLDYIKQQFQMISAARKEKVCGALSQIPAGVCGVIGSYDIGDEKLMMEALEKAYTDESICRKGFISRVVHNSLQQLEQDIMQGNVEAIKLFHMSGIDENTQLPSSKTILEAAAETQDVSVIHAVEKEFRVHRNQRRSIKVSSRQYVETDILGKFAYEGKLAALQGLVKAGFNVNAIKENPDAEELGFTHTPLQAAEVSKAGAKVQNEIIEFLNKHGAKQ